MMDYDISYSVMTTQPSADVLREAKKGSAELVILALLEDTARHGYELAARIEADSDGALSYSRDAAGLSAAGWSGPASAGAATID
jgi:hypothetical protein